MLVAYLWMYRSAPSAGGWSPFSMAAVSCWLRRAGAAAIKFVQISFLIGDVVGESGQPESEGEFYFEKFENYILKFQKNLEINLDLDNVEFYHV